MEKVQFVCERARKRARELNCEYPAVFIDVIWDEEIEGIANIMKQENFVIATTQTDILTVVFKLCQHGLTVKEPICIKDDCVDICGLIMSAE